MAFVAIKVNGFYLFQSLKKIKDYHESTKVGKHEKIKFDTDLH